ncbi:unnamed protein product [Caenorhabditis nigoni]
MLDDNKNQKDSSILESSIPAGPNGSSRKRLLFRQLHRVVDQKENRRARSINPVVSSQLIRSAILCPKDRQWMATQRTSTSSGPHPKKGTHDFSKASKKIQKLRVLETPKVRGNVMWTFIKKVEINVTGLPYAAKLPFQILLAHPNVESLSLRSIALLQPTEWIDKEICGRFQWVQDHFDQERATIDKKQHSEILKMHEDQSGLSCDEKMFLSMYPMPMSDPLG